MKGERENNGWKGLSREEGIREIREQRVNQNGRLGKTHNYSLLFCNLVKNTTERLKGAILHG